MKKIEVIKIGGNILNDDAVLSEFLDQFSSIAEPAILVHGGGKAATSIADALGIETKMIHGRRITDKDMLRVVTMVYGGLVNKNLVAKLQARNCNALGLTGADLNLIPAHKRVHPETDYGFVGDFEIEDINTDKLSMLLNAGVTPVFCALTHDGKGSLLNTNADTMASGIASALSTKHDVHLHLCFEKPGVLSDPDDDSSVITNLSDKNYSMLKEKGAIHSGMIPKLDNGFQALKNGVQSVFIRHALQLTGTTLYHEE